MLSSRTFSLISKQITYLKEFHFYKSIIKAKFPTEVIKLNEYH
jgi:hypothetical protein